MRKLFLIAGHGGKDPGALGNGYVERDLAIELRRLIDLELRRIGVVATLDPDTNYLGQSLRWLRGKFGEKDVLLDIHWNASPSSAATGSEVIIPNVSSQYEREFANALLKPLTDIGFRNRGVKPESDTARGRLALMNENAENLLLEVCFITNPRDMLLYQNSKNIIAKRLAYVIKEYLKK
jgi:N-acetylmuramoyl-L-alanine amidase